MKIYTTIILILISISLIFSQKNVSEIKDDAERIKNVSSKELIWVLDIINGFTGLGSSDWEFDLTETVKARNSKGLPTLIETREKIEGTQTWINVYSAEISYFNNDTIFEYKLKEWNTNTNNWNTELSYYEKKDEDGKKIINFVRSWDNSSQSFTSGNKEIYTYSGELKTIKEDNDWYNNTWEDFARTLYYYDSADNDTLELEQRFISSNNWRDNWKTKFIYDENNKKIFEQQWGYDWYWDEWFDYSKTTTSYYITNGLVEEVFTERYDDTKAGWYDLARTDYYYTVDNLLDYKEEHDLENSNNSLKYEYTYNENNDETSFFLYSYNGSSWTLFYKVFDTYDTNGNQTSYYSQTLDGTWKNMLKEEYIWNQFTSSGIETVNDDFISIYPNPASNLLNVNTNNKVFTNVEIVNIAGKTVRKEIISNSNCQIDISNLSSGIYFITISDKFNKMTLKFIKE